MRGLLVSATRVIRVVTRCASLDEFVATFSRFVDDRSLFIVTNQPRPIQAARPFVVQLKDGETMLRGQAEVIESHADKGGPGGRNGMRLRFLHMDDKSRDVHKALLEQRRREEPPSKKTLITAVAPPPLPPPPTPTPVLMPANG